MGQGAALPLVLPSAIAYDAQGNLYVADAGGHVVREVSAAGVVRVVAGSGLQGFAGDGGPATAAELDSPMGLAVDAAGDLFVADSHNQRVREVAAGSGVITTVAGTGAAGFAGDGGPAKAAVLDLPTALAFDAAGNLFVADTANHRVRRIAAGTGVITTVTGNGVEGFGGDGGAATAAMIDSPGGLAVDAAGNVLVAESANHRVLTISPAGVITTVASEGTQTFAGDSGPAVAASLDSPRAVALSPGGLVTLADSGNQRVRQVDGLAPPDIHTVPWVQGAGPVSVTAVPNPVAILYGQAVPVLTGTLTGVLPADAGKVTAVFASSAGVLSPVGIYPISATLTGSAAGNYVLMVAPASVTIAKAPVVVTVTSSSGSVNAGLPVTVNVSVASTTSGVPRDTAGRDGGAGYCAVIRGGRGMDIECFGPGAPCAERNLCGRWKFSAGCFGHCDPSCGNGNLGLHAGVDGFGFAVGAGGERGDVQLLRHDAGRGAVEPNPAGRAGRADRGDGFAESGEHRAGRAGGVYADDSDSVRRFGSASTTVGGRRYGGRGC